MNILIIDSGVKLKHQLFETISINLFEYNNENLYEVHDDLFGHGTAICGIITKKNIQDNFTVIRACLKSFKNESDES